MTEADWLTTTEPERLLKYVGGRASERKHRLFACACCRRVWENLTVISRAAVEVAERYSDGLEPVEALDEPFKEITDAPRSMCPPYSLAAGSTKVISAFHASLLTLRRMSTAQDFNRPFLIRVFHRKRLRSDSTLDHLALLRCIFGNPFRPIAFAPRWRSETAVALAAAIYAERAFDRLPILADALEEAGCDHADVLSHCRGPGPHARGCWVVDEVLGKG